MTPITHEPEVEKIWIFCLDPKGHLRQGDAANTREAEVLTPVTFSKTDYVLRVFCVLMSSFGFVPGIQTR